MEWAAPGTLHEYLQRCRGRRVGMSLTFPSLIHADSHTPNRWQNRTEHSVTIMRWCGLHACSRSHASWYQARCKLSQSSLWLCTNQFFFEISERACSLWGAYAHQTGGLWTIKASWSSSGRWCWFHIDNHSNTPPRIQSIAGTPPYIAPEIFQTSNYDDKVDCYSVGCIIFELYVVLYIIYMRRTDHSVGSLASSPFLRRNSR